MSRFTRISSTVLDMAVSDELIGRNLARMRGEMSQKELAARMKERGWKWSQATVWAVEKGERPLRLAESEDVKHILGTMWSLTMEDADTVVVAWNGFMYRANAELEEAVRKYLKGQLSLRVALDEFSVSPHIADLSEDWLKRTPEDVVSKVKLADDIQGDAEERLFEAQEARDGQHPEAP